MRAFVAVLEADHGVGHHDVVVHELAERLLAVGDGLLVRLDPAAQVVDRLEVERDRADAELARRAKVGGLPQATQIGGWPWPYGLGSTLCGVGTVKCSPW